MSSVSTAFKVHYKQKLGDPSGHLGGGRTMASGGIDALTNIKLFERNQSATEYRCVL